MERWSEVAARQERHRDAVREAERDRLALHELALREKRGKGERFHRRVMTRLGRGLVSWGWRLQEHSGASARAGATK
jgi:hypothetical protein